MRLSILVVAVAAALIAVTAPVQSRPSDAAVPAPVATGVIEGVVTLRPIPQRRAAARYSPGAEAPRPIQDIPAVVFLKGRVGELPPATEEVMSQRDRAFDPSLLVVAVGTVVHFPNGDPFFHNVFSYSSAARFDLGRYPQGESKEVRFAEPGIAKVYCEVHESMRAAIVVVESPHWARLDDEGRFRLEGVPVGTHTLVTWHTDRREREIRVTVTAGSTSRVEVEL